MQFSLPLLLSVLWLGAAGTAAGQTVLSLSDALQYAYQNNPNVRIAELQIRDAEWRIRENKASGLPQVTAGLSYQYFFQPPIAVLPEAFGTNPVTGELDPNFDRTQSFALSNGIAGRTARAAATVGLRSATARGALRRLAR